MRRWLLLVALVGCDPSSDQPPGSSGGIDAPTPPVPAGCITSVSPGDQQFTCGGLRTDVRIPAACELPGCGLILELHGDTGSGLLMDAHTQLRDLGQGHDYIVIAPSGPPWPGGPGSTWHSDDDATLVDIVTQFRDVFRVDPKKIHVTGFSRGGFVTWRLLCDHADLFASAAPGGAGDGAGFGETTCFEPGHVPSRNIPFLFLMGRTDAAVGYPSMVQIRDAALAQYGSPSSQVLASDNDYTWNRWGAIVETYDHAYETVADGPWASAKGHCIPGSQMDPYAPQYAIPCKLPNAQTWGEMVMNFFLEHPMP